MTLDPLRLLVWVVLPVVVWGGALAALAYSLLG